MTETNISFALTVCNEHIELEQLLAQLLKYPVENSEIVIIKDFNNTTQQVLRVIKKYEELFLPLHKQGIVHRFFTQEHPLNRNFAAHKNFLNSRCKGKWIFQLDADEVPSSEMLKILNELLESNTEVQAMWLPRINIVNGLTKQQAKEWRWNIDDKNYVNFPDWQMRIYRNLEGIKWVGDVHEKIEGFTEFGYFPQDDRFALLHIKDIDKQKAQNMFYDQINRGE